MVPSVTRKECLLKRARLVAVVQMGSYRLGCSSRRLRASSTYGVSARRNARRYGSEAIRHLTEHGVDRLGKGDGASATMVDMRRIVVVGGSGSGKTTVSRWVAETLELPCLEMDSVFHRYGWADEAPGEFLPILDRFTRRDGWVVDGNYTSHGARELVWPRADTFVWLDPPRRTAMIRIILRTLRRSSPGRSCGARSRSRSPTCTAGTPIGTSSCGPGPGMPRLERSSKRRSPTVRGTTPSSSTTHQGRAGPLPGDAGMTRSSWHCPPGGIESGFHRRGVEQSGSSSGS
jgi:hypothetical protein